LRPRASESARIAEAADDIAMNHSGWIARSQREPKINDDLMGYIAE
jgi:hypothetical protein